MSSVARNTAYLTAASVAQKVLAFAYFTAIARIVGVQNTGRYSFALAFSAIFSVVTDLGFTSVMVRDLSRSLDRAKQYLGTVLASKLLFTAIAYGLLALAVNLMGYPAETKTLVYLAGTMMILDAIALTFFAVFRATKNLRFEAIGVVIWQTAPFSSESETAHLHQLRPLKPPVRLAPPAVALRRFVLQTRKNHAPKTANDYFGGFCFPHT